MHSTLPAVPSLVSIVFGTVLSLHPTSFFILVYSYMFCRYVGAPHYEYQYTEVGSEAAGRGEWWSRKPIGQLYMPIVSAEQLRPVVEAKGWQPI